VLSPCFCSGEHSIWLITLLTMKYVMAKSAAKTITNSAITLSNDAVTMFSFASIQKGKMSAKLENAEM